MIVHYSCGFDSSCCYLAIAMTVTMCEGRVPSEDVRNISTLRAFKLVTGGCETYAIDKRI
jgi:hypothetical protein